MGQKHPILVDSPSGEVPPGSESKFSYGFSLLISLVNQLHVGVKDQEEWWVKQRLELFLSDSHTHTQTHIHANDNITPV